MWQLGRLRCRRAAVAFPPVPKTQAKKTPPPTPYSRKFLKYRSERRGRWLVLNRYKYRFSVAVQWVKLPSAVMLGVDTPSAGGESHLTLRVAQQGPVTDNCRCSSRAYFLYPFFHCHSLRVVGPARLPAPCWLVVVIQPLPWPWPWPSCHAEPPLLQRPSRAPWPPAKLHPARPPPS